MIGFKETRESKMFCCLSAMASCWPIGA